MTLEQLTAEYVAWCDSHHLPPMSADELLCKIHASGNDLPHITGWLSDFIRRWEAAADAEHEAFRARRNAQ
jgi:hypothetical protein